MDSEAKKLIDNLRKKNQENLKNYQAKMDVEAKNDIINPSVTGWLSAKIIQCQEYEVLFQQFSNPTLFDSFKKSDRLQFQKNCLLLVKTINSDLNSLIDNSQNEFNILTIKEAFSSILGNCFEQFIQKEIHNFYDESLEECVVQQIKYTDKKQKFEVNLFHIYPNVLVNDKPYETNTDELAIRIAYIDKQNKSPIPRFTQRALFDLQNRLNKKYAFFTVLKNKTMDL